MNRIQHLLTILMEECNELGQDTAKALRFGIDEQRDLPTSNRERMQKEYNDLLAITDMLNDEMSLGSNGLDLHRDPKLIRAKREKVEKYLLYSAELGELKDEKAPAPNNKQCSGCYMTLGSDGGCHNPYCADPKESAHA